MPSTEGVPWIAEEVEILANVGAQASGGEVVTGYQLAAVGMHGNGEERLAGEISVGQAIGGTAVPMMESQNLLDQGFEITFGG